MDFQLKTFLEVLERYNNEIWPLQIVAIVMAFIIFFISIKPIKFSSKVISAILAFYWLWTGIVFSLFYWSQNYKPAYIFGILFIIQGVLFVYSGVIKSELAFSYKPNFTTNLGTVFIIYSLIGYPIFGYFLAHRYPQFFPFGLVPCPTNVFTFGILLWTIKKIPKYLLVIPLFWAICGIVPISVSIYEDIGMILSGIIGTYYIYNRDKAAKNYEDAK
jgi:hypothetical protein